MTTRTDALAQLIETRRAGVHDPPDAPAAMTLSGSPRPAGLARRRPAPTTDLSSVLGISPLWVVGRSPSPSLGRSAWSAGRQRRHARRVALVRRRRRRSPRCTAWRDSQRAPGPRRPRDDRRARRRGRVARATPRSRSSRRRLRDTALGRLAIVLSAVFVGVVPLALRELFAAEQPIRAGSGRYRAAARLVLISASLLARLRLPAPQRGSRSSRSLVALPDFDVGMVVSHVVVAGFFAWVVGGWAYGALVESRHALARAGSIPTHARRGGPDRGARHARRAVRRLRARAARLVLRRRAIPPRDAPGSPRPSTRGAASSRWWWSSRSSSRCCSRRAPLLRRTRRSRADTRCSRFPSSRCSVRSSSPRRCACACTCTTTA